ncbi:MAG: ABC transporter ATP-binding protein [Peptoniphilaceae bacterium]|nr:ABC transporter ATP-binding protein [Peptoniphilaceae bacterium]MDY6019746.1 ABC transporter ATP-binding protein [Anaerococcus sp.]
MIDIKRAGLREGFMEFERIIKVEKLSKSFGSAGAKTFALNSISFDVLDGEFLAIMGASGSGKTTLLNCISTMTKPSKGNIFFEGKKVNKFREKRLVKYRSEDISYVYQDFKLLDNLTVKENIILPLVIQKRQELMENLDKLVDEFKLENLLGKYTTEISGGEKQKVAIARALITNPRIILADEPTGALDSVSSRLLLEKFYSLNKNEGKTILMVTHDVNAASFATRILFIKDGSIYHEIRRKDKEMQKDYYDRISRVVKQLSSNKLYKD